MNSVRSYNLSLKYQRFTLTCCKDIGIKMLFFAKTPFLNDDLSEFHIVHSSFPALNFQFKKTLAICIMINIIIINYYYSNCILVCEDGELPINSLCLSLVFPTLELNLNLEERIFILPDYTRREIFNILDTLLQEKEDIQVR